MYKRSALIVFLFAILLSNVQNAWACEPQPAYWFAERYEFGPVNLPKSIELVNSPKAAAQGYFEITNHSDKLLYILPMDALPSLVATAKPSISGDVLSEEQTSEEIILVDRAPELATFVINAGESLQLDKKNFPTLVPYIEERNILEFSRPHFVYLPITQRGEFLLVLDDQLITVPFMISYAINENFRPEICEEVFESSVQKDVVYVEESSNSILVSTIAFGVIVLVTLGAMFWLRKQTTVE